MTLAEILLRAAECPREERHTLWLACAEARHATSLPIPADHIARLPTIPTSAAAFHYCPSCWTVFYADGRALNEPTGIIDHAHGL